MIIGRENEMRVLKELYKSDKAQFVVVYGRRRVGKTFLVDETLYGNITFRHAGLSPIDDNGKKNLMPEQLEHFYHSLLLQGMKKSHVPTSWLEAFFMLEMHLQQIDNGKRQVVFLDELPWMDTPRSKFVSALEGFWNGWACHRHNLMLVVSGSANSWIQDKLINNKGGLYGRLDRKIKLRPFTLHECEQFYRMKRVKMSHYDIVQSYMILGGIPYYMNFFEPQLSLSQNIDRLFFANEPHLRNEYAQLFRSVFSDPELMRSIVDLLGTRHRGFTRPEILAHVDKDDSGSLSEKLNALVASNFVEKYVPFGNSARDVHYKLVDPFCWFYQHFVRDQKTVDPDFWTHNQNAQRIVSWRGIAFEEVCLQHIRNIKRALGIEGVVSAQSAWTVKGDDEVEGTQIDLLINRQDNVVNMCEMKFYSDEFVVSKEYDRKLAHREILLSEQLPRKTVVHRTLVTTYGLKYTEYSSAFQSVVTMADLFKE